VIDLGKLFDQMKEERKKEQQELLEEVKVMKQT